MRVQIKSLLSFFAHFLLICLFSALLANFTLFPFYALQHGYPSFFPLTLAGLLLLGMIYYAYVYWSTAASQGNRKHILIGWILLSYRLLRNTFFLTSVFLFLILLAAAMLLFTFYNIDIVRKIY